MDYHGESPARPCRPRADATRPQATGSSMTKSCALPLLDSCGRSFLGETCLDVKTPFFLLDGRRAEDEGLPPHVDPSQQATWDAIARGLTAHVVMLRDMAIIDDAMAGSLLTAIDGVRRGEPPPTSGSLTLVGAFDDRVDSLTAPGAAGGGGIARARYDLAATAQRLVLRDQMLVLAKSLHDVRAALLDLAEEHVFTLMQAWSEIAPLQPTNLAHFLTGTIAPLGRVSRRLHVIYEDLDRSPLGAAALAGPGLPVDREETADLLGMEGPVESTFDAVSAVDHIAAAAQIAADSVSPLERLTGELLIWLRTDPQAIRLADEALAPPDASLPHLRSPRRWNSSSPGCEK